MQEMQEMQVQSLGQKDPWGRVGHGNPLQYSCLENPTVRRDWWAAIHGVCKESDMAEATEHSCIHNGQSLPVSKLTKTFSVCAVVCQMAIIMIMPSF